MAQTLESRATKKLHRELGLGITSEAFHTLANENLSVLQQTFLLDTVLHAGLEEEELLILEETF